MDVIIQTICACNEQQEDNVQLQVHNIFTYINVDVIIYTALPTLTLIATRRVTLYVLVPPEKRQHISLSSLDDEAR